MARISAYHRPSSVEDALALLHRSTVRTVVLGGGTTVVPSRFEVPTEVVDLQSCGLAGIVIDRSTARIGATTALDTIVDDAAMPFVLRDAARREQPSTLRTLATIGGVVVGRHRESELLAALLVLDAVVTFVNGSGAHTRSLDDALADPSVLHNAIVTAIEVQIDGGASAARTGRTPFDSPIVAVVGRRRPDGSTVVAATGVATTPVRIDHPGAVEPPGDFRGSSAYRRHLVVELTARVTAALEVLA